MHSSSRQFSDYNRIRGKIVQHRMIESTDRMMRLAPQTDNYPLSSAACVYAILQMQSASKIWIGLRECYSTSCEQESKSRLTLLSTELAVVMHWYNAPFKLWQHHSCDGEGREETDSDQPHPMIHWQNVLHKQDENVNAFVVVSYWNVGSNLSSKLIQIFLPTVT